MSKREGEIEGLLAQLIAGERREDEPQVRQLLSARPDLRERLARLRALAGRLDAIGAAGRAAVAEAHAQGSPLESQVRPMLDAASRVGPARARRVAAAAAAAALVLAALAFALLARTPARPTRDSTLGPAPGALQPRGAVAAFDRFSWNLPLPPAGTYVLRFFDATGAGERLLLEVDAGTRQQWSPSVEQRARMSARMRWEVEARDAAGVPRGGAGPVTVYLAR
jgi:hypothetical protein